MFMGDELVLLPCSHVFHEYCLTIWYYNSKQLYEQKCPYCNQEINWLDVRYIQK